MTPADFHAWLRNPGRRALVMGVLNVTPDSFSDGGAFECVELAVKHACKMARDGADLIDIGGESTRPGSLPVESSEQIRRVVPVVRAIVQECLPTAISVDTTQADVAEAALDAGANLINDISAGRDSKQMFPLAAARKAPLILMHMQGRPATMQQAPTYDDVTIEVVQFLKNRVEAACRAGIDVENVLVDPGIGFGKTTGHNLELLRNLRDLADAVARPLVLGSSRKGFIGGIMGEPDPSRRVYGTAATVAWGIANGARLLRVHDVGPMAQVVRMIEAIEKK